MPFIIPSHTPFQWHNAPVADTPLDSAHLEAAEVDLLEYTQTIVGELDGFSATIYVANAVATTPFTSQGGKALNPGQVVFSTTSWDPFANPIPGNTTPSTYPRILVGDNYLDVNNTPSKKYIWESEFFVTNSGLSATSATLMAAHGFKPAGLNAVARVSGLNGLGYGAELEVGAYLSRADVTSTNGTSILNVTAITWSGSRFDLGAMITDSVDATTASNTLNSTVTGGSTTTFALTGGGAMPIAGSTLVFSQGGLTEQAVVLSVASPNVTVTAAMTNGYTAGATVSWNALITAVDNPANPTQITISNSVTGLIGTPPVDFHITAQNQPSNTFGLLISGSGGNDSGYSGAAGFLKGAGNPSGIAIAIQGYTNSTFQQGIHFSGSGLDSSNGTPAALFDPGAFPVYMNAINIGFSNALGADALQSQAAFTLTSGGSIPGGSIPGVGVAVRLSNPSGGSWAANHTYTTGVVIQAVADDAKSYYFEATTGGMSAGSVPTFPHVTGNTVADSGVTWTCLGVGSEVVVVDHNINNVITATTNLVGRYAAGSTARWAGAGAGIGYYMASCTMQDGMRWSGGTYTHVLAIEGGSDPFGLYADSEAVLFSHVITGNELVLVSNVTTGSGHSTIAFQNANPAGAGSNQYGIRFYSTNHYSGNVALQLDGQNIDSDTTTGMLLAIAASHKLAFYGGLGGTGGPIIQPSAVGTTTGYAAGSTGATFHSDDTYTGNVGSKAYTLNGIVAALKNLGLIASS